MNPERWKAVKSQFLEASALPPEEHSAFLADLESADREIAALVEELLAVPAEQGPDLRHACWSTPAEAVPLPAFEPGRKLLDRFEITGLLGSGGLGEVYRAFDHQQKVFVALKTLRPALAMDEAATSMLRNEVNIARSVTHPNVCRIYDFHAPPPGGGPPFVTMEWLQGETLAQRIRRDGPLDAPSAAAVVNQLLDALDTAHNKGIIHRDFKTANVMLTESGGKAVVMDFGLARELKPGSDLRTTMATGTFAGTPAYMAPEQLRGQGSSVATDIHALGVVLFEICAGRLPFIGPGPLEIAAQRLRDEPPSPRRFAPGLDRRWEYTILRCLEREPRMRPPTVQAVRESLGQAPPFLRFHRRKFIAGGVAVSLLAGGGALVSLGGWGMPVTVTVFDIEDRTQGSYLNYLCGATTNELVRRLGQLKNLTVIPARATRSQAPPRRSGRIALDGWLEEDNGRVRLSLQMIDTKARQLIWLEHFDRDRFGGVLAMQEQIARGAASQLTRYLARHDRNPLKAAFGWAGSDSMGPENGSPTANPLAFDLYLRANSLMQEGTQESLRAAVEQLELATREDGHFALAYASLSEAHLALRNFSYTPDDQLSEPARNYAQKAILEDPGLAEGHAALAAVKQLDWDWRGSEASYDRALQLKPGFPRARRWRAGLIMQFARFDEALLEMQRAFEQDPYDRAGVSGYGLTLLFAGRYRQAAEFLARQIGDRDMAGARHNLCQAYVRLGSLASGAESDEYSLKAIAEAERVASIERRTPTIPSQLSNHMFALIYSARKQIAEAEPYVRRLIAGTAERRTSPVYLAMVYAVRGELETALRLVEQAVATRDHFVLFLRVNVFLEALRAQPRFDALLRTVHLV